MTIWLLLSRKAKAGKSNKKKAVGSFLFMGMWLKLMRQCVARDHRSVWLSLWGEWAVTGLCLARFHPACDCGRMHG